MTEEKQKKRKKGGWFGKALLACLILALLGIGALALILYSFGSYDDTKLHNDPQTTLIYDRDGSLALSVHGEQDRINIPISEIPQTLVNAFLAAEDLRFYDHMGFDIIRIGGALIADIKSGSLDQGASTITQQLVKNTHLTPEKSWMRKLKEAYFAYQIEQDYSKDDILAMYMNHVYLGNGAYGVQAAAQTYFGKGVSELSLAQCASIAAILKAPSNYAPHIEPANNERRRDIILNTMLEEHMISQREYNDARAMPLGLVDAENDASGGHGWFTDAALEEARQALNIDYEALLSGGYRIHTTLDSSLQAECEKLFNNVEMFPPDAADGTPAQAALAVVDVKSGGVRALIGGREYETRRGLNRASQMRRQPGSALKPFVVYGPAIERYGYTAVSILDDSPIDIGGYAPGNYGGTFRGPVTLRVALANSINVPAVLILNEIGVQTGRESAERFGIVTDPNDNFLPLALGAMTYGTTPLELCNAYATLANEGKRIENYLVTQIFDNDGTLMYEAAPQENQALSAPATALLTDLLRSAALWGTGSKIGAVGYEAAAKTGTVAFEGALEGGSNRDAWTAAYTPNVAICVWMGFDVTDEAHALPKSVTGGGLPATVAARVLALAQQENVPFPKEAGVWRVELDKRALEQQFLALRATNITPTSEILDEVFIPGTEPTAFSEYWVIPKTPADFTLQRGMSGFPEIRFTILDAFARYRLYRAGEDGVFTEAQVFSGNPGEVVIHTDLMVERQENYSYYIVPEHAEAVDLGVINAIGGPTPKYSYRVPFLPFDLPFDIESILNPPTPTPSASSSNDDIDLDDYFEDDFTPIDESNPPAVTLPAPNRNSPTPNRNTPIPSQNTSSPDSAPVAATAPKPTNERPSSVLSTSKPTPVKPMFNLQ